MWQLVSVAAMVVILNSRLVRADEVME